MRRRVRSFLLVTVAASNLAFLVAGPALAQNTPVDNTKTNKRDRASAEPTADQAKDNMSDRDMMRKIRRAVLADKSMSTYAHNVKIIAQHGKVTLKGPVHSEEESKAIEAKAVQVAGSGKVTNQLAVKGDKAGKKVPAA